MLFPLFLGCFPERDLGRDHRRGHENQEKTEL